MTTARSFRYALFLLLGLAAAGFKDAKLGDVAGIVEWDREGAYPDGAAALSMATTICNVGDENIPWIPPMGEDHPGTSMALYRELDGRLEMIGVSDMKHGFAAAVSEGACTPCLHPSDGTYLGITCSDTYYAGTNANRLYLGPRGEWDPHAGTWECTGSHFSGGVPDCYRRHRDPAHPPLVHRLAAKDEDLGVSGATYSYEAYCVVRGDMDKSNNVAWRSCSMSWDGSVWQFTTTDPGDPPVWEPRIESWGEMQTQADLEPADGSVTLAVQTTDLGGGNWAYEYALYNLDLDRAVRSFSIPVSASATVGGLEFHDPDLVDTNEWSVTVSGGVISWSTDEYAVNPGANALGFGVLYNFRFEADVAPVSSQVDLGLFKPGTPTTLSMVTLGPSTVATTVGAEAPDGAFRLLQNSPNPVGRQTAIRFMLAGDAPAELEIFDTRGRRVRDLSHENSAAGEHVVRWDATDEHGARVAPGVYYYRLRVGRSVQARTMIVVE